MSKKNLIIVIAVAIIVIVVAVYFAFSFMSGPANVSSLNSLAGQNKPLQSLKSAEELKQEAAAQLVQINKDYPDKIAGIINFYDTKGAYKATIKTNDGKEYMLLPPQPQSIYTALFGVKNGQKVEVQGELDNKGGLGWAVIKPI
jgi:hypothetical protein